MAHLGKRSGAYRLLVGKPEGKRLLGRSCCRWGNVKMDLQEVGWRGMDWLDLVRNRESGGLLCTQ